MQGSLGSWSTVRTSWRREREIGRQLWSDPGDFVMMECGERVSHHNSLNPVKNYIPPSADSLQDSYASVESCLLGVLLKGKNPLTTLNFLPLLWPPIICFTWLQAYLCLAWKSWSHLGEENETDMTGLFSFSLMSFKYTFWRRIKLSLLFKEGLFKVTGWRPVPLGRCSPAVPEQSWMHCKYKGFCKEQCDWGRCCRICFFFTCFLHLLSSLQEDGRW